MNNLFTAFSVAVISQLRFALFTDSVDSAVESLTGQIIKFYKASYVVVDMNEEPSEEKLVEMITQAPQDGGEVPELVNIVVFKKLEATSASYQRKIIHFINALDSYNTNSSRLQPQPIQFERSKASRPQIFMIIPVIKRQEDGTPPQLVPHLRHKFAFSQFYNAVDGDSVAVSVAPDLLALRSLVDQVFVSPEIRGYIYSLLVHIRTHRLCSLNSMGARPPTGTLDWVRMVAAAMVVWNEHVGPKEAREKTDTKSAETSGEKEETEETETEKSETEKTETEKTDTEKTDTEKSDTEKTDTEKSGDEASGTISPRSLSEENELFLTPTFVQVATRKVAYFQVDWESDTIFSRHWRGPEKHRQQEISMLTGDWYGSEWVFVKRYIDEHRSQPSDHTPTGTTNDVVEEAIARVRPPI
ncbi:hypothetical protein JA9_001926 [Meyerozyma sp. JA9]|nr:hypothetical protein JA9_001926 [Meyerozyma sp. JA9]